MWVIDVEILRHFLIWCRRTSDWNGKSKLWALHVCCMNFHLSWWILQLLKMFFCNYWRCCSVVTKDVVLQLLNMLFCSYWRCCCSAVTEDVVLQLLKMLFCSYWRCSAVTEDVVPRQLWMKDDVIWSGGNRKGSGRGNLGSLLQERQCTLRTVKPFFHWKSNIICSECVFVPLVIQHAMHMRHIVISGL